MLILTPCVFYSLYGMIVLSFVFSGWFNKVGYCCAFILKRQHEYATI